MRYTRQLRSGLDDADSIASITAHLAFLKAEIKASDKHIANAIAADPDATRKARLLVTIPGIAATTAAVLSFAEGAVEGPENQCCRFVAPA